jgi:hypothetical protein
VVAYNSSDESNYAFIASTTTAAAATLRSGAVGNVPYIPLLIETGNSVRATFDINGNVGIGNTTPVDTLSVGGNAYVSGNVTGGNILTTGRLTTKTSVITKTSLGAVSGAVAINCSTGSVQTLTTNGNITLSFTNWPLTGTYQSVSLEITVANTSHIITGPAGLINGFGIVGLDYAASTMTFPATGVYTFTFSSSDGGTTISIAENNSILRPYNSSSETITSTANATVSLGNTYSIYYPSPISSAGTATLANGVAGQTKIVGSLGTSTWNVAVSGSSWGTPTGNINFTGAGQNVTLVWSSGLNVWLVLNIYGNATLS